MSPIGFVILALLAVASVHFPAAPADAIKDAAEKFLAVLEPAQRTKAVLPFHSPAREDFRHTCRGRAGLPLNCTVVGGKAVIFSARPPGEILTAENRKAIVLETVGVAASKMNAGQKKALHDLIWEYTGRHREALAENDMRKTAAAGVGRIHFGWAGSIKPGEAFYYRVQGPTFLLECANTRNDANHIHTTWREFEGDFGRDLMKEHYHQHRHDGGRHWTFCQRQFPQGPGGGILPNPDLFRFG